MTSFALLDEDPRYMIDSEGNVYGPRGGILKPFLTGEPNYKYPTVTLGHKDKRSVHRLVAKMFVPNPDGEPVVAHGDGDPMNPAAWNLRWASQKENVADKKLHGTHTSGDQHHLTVVSDAGVAEIRRLREAGVPVRDIAARYGVTRWSIYDYCNPKRSKRVNTVGG